MDPARERLLAHLIDLAGTRAPEASLTEWRDRQAGPEARMFRALAWSAADLDRLDAMDIQGDVTVIGSPGENWDLAREEDAAALTRFARTLPDRIGLVAYEGPLPTDRPAKEALDSLSGFGAVQVYVETTDPEALAEIAERDWASAKFRTSGASAPALAEFLYACVSLELPFKLAGIAAALTKGESLGGLNALAATALAIADDLTPEEIANVLRDERGAWREIEREEAEDARGLFEAIEIDAPAELLSEFLAGLRGEDL